MQSCQACFEELEKHIEMSEEKGKIVFVKEHGKYLIEPTAQTKFFYGQHGDREFPWKVQAHFNRSEIAQASNTNHTGRERGAIPPIIR